MSNTPRPADLLPAIADELAARAGRFQPELPPAEGVKWLRALRERAQTMEAALVAAMLDAGATWRELGAELGLTPSVVHRTYAKRVAAYREYRDAHPDGPHLVRPVDAGLDAIADASARAMVTDEPWQPPALGAVEQLRDTAEWAELRGEEVAADLAARRDELDHGGER